MTTCNFIDLDEHNSPRSARSWLAIAILGLLALLVTGCGIDFGEASTETEIFKDLTIEGPIVAGEPVEVSLKYAQQYDVSLEIKCDLLSTEDVPTVTPLPTETVSPLILRRTPEPTLPGIPLVRPTPRNKVQEIFGTTLRPNENGGPVGEATPVLEIVDWRFFAPAPGEYVVWCYTTLDLNNAIFEDFAVPE